MKKIRRILALLVALALFGFATAGCGSSNNSNAGGTGTATADNTGPGDTVSKDSADANAGEIQKVVMAMISFNKIPDDMTRINNAISKLTIAKANVETDLRLYGPADYEQKVNLALASGEQMDIFLPPLSESLGSWVAKGQLLALDDLIPKYGTEMINKLNQDFGEGLLKATTIDGHVYAIPVNKGMSIPATFIYNADMLKSAGLTENDFNSLEDLAKVFEAVKAKNPDVIPFGPINANPSDTGLMWYLNCVGEVDKLAEPSEVGVVLGDSGKVVNMYETDLFKNGVKVVRDWYLKGYIQKDAATATTGFWDVVSSGRGFAFMGGYSGKEIGKLFSAQSGKNIASKRIAPFYFDTSAVNSVVWAVNSNTGVPEGAMKLLGLTYTDTDVLNTILYGVEGEDYIKVDEHHMKYPDGKTPDTVEYSQPLCSGVLGSESMQYILEGSGYEDIQLKIEENRTTKRSPYFGFVFDPRDVKTELSTINNVKNQYLPGLVCGALDPDTTIPKFIKALNDAGAQTVIQKKQEQLDKWLSEQKKQADK